MNNGFTVTRLRARQAADPYAHGPNSTATQEDWDNPERTVLDDVVVAPTSSVVQFRDDSAPILSGTSLLWPNRSDVDVTARDRFTISGSDAIWLAAGDPEIYISPFTGWVGGTLLHLNRQENG